MNDTPSTETEATEPAALAGIYPRRLAEAEQRLVEARRAVMGSTGGSPVLAGLALSGGGIRSATFCLGFMQALADRKLLQRFDFLSTVSGGGYIGSFLGAWINRARNAGTVQEQLSKAGSPPVLFLRNNGRYLAPNGAADAMAAMASHLRSWLTMWLVLGLVGFGAFLLVETAKMGLDHEGWLKSLTTTVPDKESETIALREANGVAVATSAPASVSVTTGEATAVPAVSVSVALAPEKESMLAAAMRYLRLSPLFKVAGWVLLGLGLPAAVAYWFAGRSVGTVFIWILLIGVGVALGRACAGGMTEKWTNFNCWLLWATYGVTVALAGWATALGRHPDVPRNTLNDWLAHVLALAAAVAALAVVDTVGLTLTTNGVWSAVILPVLAMGAQWLLPQIMEGTKDDKRKWWTALLLPAGAVVVAIIAFGILSKEAHWLAGVLSKSMSTAMAGAILAGAGVIFVMVSVFQFRSAKRAGAAIVTIVGFALLAWWLGTRGGNVRAHALIVGASAMGVVAMGALVGFSFAFVNLSSHHRLYSARLTRTYLGASNPARTGSSDSEVKNPKGDPPGLDGPPDPRPNGPPGPGGPPDAWSKGPTGPDGRDVTTAVPGDQIPYRDYRPHAHGGPLHLINVTVNETIDGISQIEQKDRHGFSLAIGPVGLSARTKDHALFAGHTEAGAEAPASSSAQLKSNASGFGARVKTKEGRAKLRQSAREMLQTFGVQGTRVWLERTRAKQFHTLATEDGERVSVEMPPLGAWVGISGAAFTTGSGARTSPAFSFLLGFFNVRLGYWWDSGIAPIARKHRAARGAAVTGDLWSRLFPAQAGLLDEWMARFRGAARQHWYLSDGGHFENCAVYELIRRRLPLIVCCDCGADPDYEFEDLGNLVRKARIDFDAEVKFWSSDDVKKSGNGTAIFEQTVGSLDDLKPAKEGKAEGLASRHAAIAWITYRDGQRSLLLVVKPTLSDDVPIDLRNYNATDTRFPQQSTLDQFFDEAQWESYRKLGSFIGHKLFDDPEPHGQRPWRALEALAETGRSHPDRLLPVS